MHLVFIDLSVKEAYVKSVCRLLVGSAVLLSIVALGGKKIDQLSYEVANSIVNHDKKAVTVALAHEFGTNPAASYDRKVFAYNQAKKTYKFSVATATNATNETVASASADTDNIFAYTLSSPSLVLLSQIQ